MFYQIQTSQGDGVHTVQTIAEVGSQGEVVDLNSVTEATLSQDGQIILTSEDGHGKVFMMNGLKFAWILRSG